MNRKGLSGVGGVIVLVLVVAGIYFIGAQMGYFPKFAVQQSFVDNPQQGGMFTAPLAVEGVIKGKYGDSGADSGYVALGTTYDTMNSYQASSGVWNSGATKYAPNTQLIRHAYASGYYDIWDTVRVPSITLAEAQTGLVSKYDLGRVELNKRVTDSNLKVNLYSEAGALIGSATGATDATDANIIINTEAGKTFTVKLSITLAEYKVSYGVPTKVLMASPTYYLKDTQAIVKLELEGTTYSLNNLINRGWVAVNRYATLNNQPSTVLYMPIQALYSTESNYGSIDIYIPLDFTVFGTGNFTKAYRITVSDMINLQDAQQNAGATVPASGAGITSALDAVISGFVVANII